VEQWTNIGLWVMSRADADYPQRLKERLGSSAPVLLYGAGDHRLLTRGGVAIVGSRDADEVALNFAQRLSERCAADGLQVVSGGARGVDGHAMQTAYAAGGTVVGVLAEGLAREMVAEKYREALVEERLTLVSPYHPRAGFSPGNAMERNRYIYALADWAVVASSDVEKGGTWNGAVEDLKHTWVPLFVRDGDDVPPGNRRLIKRGGIPMTEDVFDSRDRLRDWFESHRRASDAQPQTELLLESDRIGSFEEIWPRLKEMLQEAHTDHELVERLGVGLKTVRQWLKQAVAAEKVKKSKNPVKYIVDRHE
jgi:predicted Rossmann fold nucleotide-binding protein DprA/Smf involved in DNA uptake